MKELLSGVRVIDLTTVAMGPLASQWLGDLGADVIKIESPEGDSTRKTGPFTEDGMAALFMSVNRNKRSVVLDIKTKQGLAALLELIQKADVFMHNIRPQKIKKLGLDHESLRLVNPSLVYAGLHGFGEKGPYGGKPAYDDIIQGLSGAADLMAKQSGVASYLPTILADKTTGLIAALTILAGLYNARRTGEGTALEIPMFECMSAFNLVEHLYGEQFVPAQSPMGYPRVLSKNRHPYKTKDGFIGFMAYTDNHWWDFFMSFGNDDLANDMRFETIASRTNHIDELYLEVARILEGRSTEEWIADFDHLNIPCSKINSIESLVNDVHLSAVDFFSSLHDKAIGEVRMPGVPVLIDGKRPSVRMPPRLGEHTVDVLLEAGIDPSLILNTIINSK